MTHTLHTFAVVAITFGLGTFALDVIVVSWSRAMITRRALLALLDKEG